MGRGTLTLDRHPGLLWLLGEGQTRGSAKGMTSQRAGESEWVESTEWSLGLGMGGSQLGSNKVGPESILHLNPKILQIERG